MISNLARISQIMKEEALRDKMVYGQKCNLKLRMRAWKGWTHTSGANGQQNPGFTIFFGLIVFVN